jgi:hypothetical protein
MLSIPEAVRDAPPPPPEALLPLGALADGTRYFAPPGVVVAEGDLVLCHLCGCWRRSVTAHLRAHGWSKEAYCTAFGLERGQSLEGASTRKMRAASFTARLLFEPAVRTGSARGRARARSGELARDAAAAARGRPLPAQRRRKTSESLAGREHPASSEASRERARRQLSDVAAHAAAAAGYADIGALVRARVASGASLAAVSREAGLHKDWLSRHLTIVDPAAAAAVAAAGAGRDRVRDARWRAAAAAAGFADAPAFLRERHVIQHRSVNEIAAEVGMSYHAVAAALARHDLARVAHAGSRHSAGVRVAAVVSGLGYETVADYVCDRRAAGWTWSALAAESGQPQSWLRRHGPAA